MEQASGDHERKKMKFEELHEGDVVESSDNSFRFSKSPDFEML